jgi:hypothetical protein
MVIDFFMEEREMKKRTLVLALAAMLLIVMQVQGGPKQDAASEQLR